MMHRYSKVHHNIGSMTMNLVQRRLFWWVNYEIQIYSHFVVLQECKFSEHVQSSGSMGMHSM